MRLAALRFENFRSWKEKAALETFRPITVLIGPNNSGKSNILQFLTYYQAGGGRQTEIAHTGNRADPTRFEVEVEYGEDERTQLVGEFPFASESIRTSIKDSSFLRRMKHLVEIDRSGLLEETVSIMYHSGKFTPIFGYSSTSKGQCEFWRLPLTKLVKTMTTSGDLTPGQRDTLYRGGVPGGPFQWRLEENTIETKLANILRSFISRWLLIPPIRFMNPRMNPSQQVRVMARGDNVVQVLNTLQTDDPERFLELTRQIYRLVPGMQRITAPPRGNEVTTIVREPGGVEVEAKDVSSGLQQAMILVANLLTSPPNSLIMIEEPEIHLHASSQRALLQLMRELAASAGHQFILATHSTIFAWIDGETATYLVTKGNGSSRIRELVETAELRAIKTILGHENTDLFGYRAVILVEGETETVALPLIAKYLGFDLMRLGLHVVNVRGAGKLTRIRELLRFLKESDTRPFAMLDGLSETKQEVEDWVREGLIAPDDVFIWPKEFEDCFEDEILARALRAWGTAHGLSLNVDGEELRASRATGASAAHILARLVFDQTERGLSKPELGEMVVQELGATRQNGEPSLVEKALQKVCRSIQSSAQAA